MSAMNMMLKSLGIDIDPEKLMSDFQAIASDIAKLRASVERTEAIALQNNELLKRLDKFHNVVSAPSTYEKGTNGAGYKGIEQ